MARKRMISPEIWQSEDFSELSTLAKLVFIGLFSNADDEGRGRARAVYIKSIVLPYEEGIRVADIEKSLDEIAAHMSVIFYTHDGNEYYELTNWNVWQKVDKPQKSKIPPYNSDDSEIIRGTFGEQSANNRRTVPPNRIEKNRIEKEQEENVDCSEPKPVPEPAVITLPLNDKTEYPVYQSDISEWQGLYPAVDVMQELRNMKGWCDGNPTKRKTKTGIRKFIYSWLAREQNKGGNQKGRPIQPSSLGATHNHDELEDIAIRRMIGSG